MSMSLIKEVDYPKWVYNIVIVPRKNNEIRVCIDFTNLNKVGLIHPYPLLCISDLVDAIIDLE